MNASDWRTFLFEVDPTLSLSEGASEIAIVEAERQLGQRLPSDMRSLLEVTNGINDARQWCNFCWTLDRIVAENLWFRSDDCPQTDDGLWDERLCFATNGADATFYLLPLGDRAVWAWYPIGAERRKIATDVREYLRGWISGTITT